jgi:NADP-dependent 3-hydroxy acid dehydrogenase YdfG
MNQLYATAIDAGAIGRAIACAIEQPGDFEVNEIIIRPTSQELETNRKTS